MHALRTRKEGVWLDDVAAVRSAAVGLAGEHEPQVSTKDNESSQYQVARC
jgi:hypothetical protein